MINSKGETIYTNAEVGYELGLSPATISVINRRNENARERREGIKALCEDD